MAKKKEKKIVDGLLKFNRVKPLTNVAISALFIFLALLCFMPALLVLIVSFSSEKSVVTIGYSYFPLEWSLASYTYLFNQGAYIGKAFINSIFVTITGTALGLVMCSTMGYALSRPNYRLRKFFSYFILIPMLFSGGLVASYMINVNILGLKNTYWALILPICCSSFYVVIMRTFFQTSVPEAIIESARIDGSGEWRTLLQIVAPLAIPGFATVGLFSAIGIWNDFRNCMLINDSAQYYNLQYTIYQTMNNLRFLKENASRMGGVNVANLPAETFRMAMAVVTVGPIIMAYPFFQKYFVKGLTVGAVKG
jgi:putative aldouronate transport system permease protein